ncbi:MAG: hypothetical protein ACE5JU_12040, partial [Candidatus Binatia bacterium]
MKIARQIVPYTLSLSPSQGERIKVRGFRAWTALLILVGLILLPLLSTAFGQEAQSVTPEYRAFPLPGI